MIELASERLLLRAWRAADREPFAALNADPIVMRHFMQRLSRTESDELADEIEEEFRQEGWGLWALEERSTSIFIGFTGLSRPPFESHFTPNVEIGWRLARHAWGRGLATRRPALRSRSGSRRRGWRRSSHSRRLATSDHERSCTGSA